MSKRAEYRTKDYAVYDRDTTEVTARAVESIPAGMYTPASEAAAMAKIGLNPQIPTEHPMDDEDDDTLTIEDMAVLKTLAKEWENR